MKKILVLGATGAMGAPLVRILAGLPDVEVYASSRKPHTGEAIHWKQGNAKDFSWTRSLLEEIRFDAIVDFLSYSTAEFQERYQFFLGHTAHYLFLSSARVYAKSESLLTENSPRILDVCTDEAYLAGDSYDLAKAREENLLNRSGKNNYTIIRPSLTYNSARMQFTLFELDEWIYRVLDGNSILFPEEMAEIRTTMTHGDDVAAVIARLILNPAAFGETFNINGGGSRSWEEILRIYQNAIQSATGKPVKYCPVKDAAKIASALNRYDQYRLARGISREFSNAKVEAAIGGFQWRSPEEGLTQCVEQFFGAGASVRRPGVRRIAYYDRLTGEHTKLSHFPTTKEKLLYCLCRTGITACR